MEFKKVNGLGKSYYVERAFNVAMERGYGPEFVSSWEDWFERHKGDCVSTAELNAEEVAEMAQRTLAEILSGDWGFGWRSKACSVGLELEFGKKFLEVLKHEVTARNS